jgi:hypothetical protein
MDTENEFDFEIGDSVLLRFKVDPPVDGCEGERMWVRVTGVLSDALCGLLDNDPVLRTDLHCGEPVKFQRADVIDMIAAGDDEPRSESIYEAGPIKDELGDRRKVKTQRDALDDMAKTFMGADHVQDFGQWASANMPAQEFVHHAHSVIGGMLGLVIDTWLLSGASPELLKEYLTRFVDMQVAQREMAAKLFPQPPCDH